MIIIINIQIISMKVVAFAYERFGTLVIRLEVIWYFGEGVR